VPKKTGSEKKGSERKRDKILGFFVGAKGNQQKDVEGCRAHIQVRLCTPLMLKMFALRSVWTMAWLHSFAGPALLAVCIFD